MTAKQNGRKWLYINIYVEFAGKHLLHPMDAPKYKNDLFLIQFQIAEKQTWNLFWEGDGENCEHNIRINFHCIKS